MVPGDISKDCDGVSGSFIRLQANFSKHFSGLQEVTGDLRGVSSSSQGDSWGTSRSQLRLWGFRQHLKHLRGSKEVFECHR